MQYNEIFRQDSRASQRLYLFIIPFLAVLDLATRPSEVLSLMHDQLACLRVDLPLNDPQIRASFEELASEATRIVEMSITKAVSSDYLHKFRGRHYFPLALVADYD